MAYWLCPACETASLTWPSLRWHISGKHRDMEIPEKEEIQVTEELPEGYRVIGQYKRGVAAPIPKEEKEEKREISVEELPEELPEEFTERVKQVLIENEIPEKLISPIIVKVKRHPQVQETPNAFSNLLTSIFGTSLLGRKYMGKIGWIVSEVFGTAPSQPGAPPFPEAGITPAPPWSWYQYPSYSGWYPSYSSRQPYFEEERPREVKLPETVKSELSEIRQSYEETKRFLQSVAEELSERRKREEEEKLESRFAHLEEKLERKTGGETDWLQAYLTERDKREEAMQHQYQETIKDLGDKLASATKDVAETRREIDDRISEAINRERMAKEEIKKELEAAGWHPKERTKEELDHELAQQVLSVVPEKIDKGFDKLAEKIPIGGTQSQPTTPEEPSRPRTPQEIVEQSEIEDAILEEGKRRGQA